MCNMCKRVCSYCNLKKHLVIKFGYFPMCNMCKRDCSYWHLEKHLGFSHEARNSFFTNVKDVKTDFLVKVTLKITSDNDMKVELIVESWHVGRNFITNSETSGSLKYRWLQKHDPRNLKKSNKNELTVALVNHNRKEVLSLKTNF